MKTVRFIFIFSFSYVPLVAQQEVPPRNILHTELWGSSLGYSINYERVFPRKTAQAFSMRGGVGVSSNRFALPVSVQYFRTRKRGSLEGTLGISYLYGAQRVGPREGQSFGSGIFVVPGLGYRYQGQKGFFFRLTAYGLFKIAEFSDSEAIRSSRFVPSAGMSLGYSFR